jgi:hypothetical protein
MLPGEVYNRPAILAPPLRYLDRAIPKMAAQGGAHTEIVEGDNGKTLPAQVACEFLVAMLPHTHSTGYDDNRTGLIRRKYPKLDSMTTRRCDGHILSIGWR